MKTKFKIVTGVGKQWFEDELSKLTSEGWKLLSREALIVTEKSFANPDKPTEPRFTTMLYKNLGGDEIEKIKER